MYNFSCRRRKISCPAGSTITKLKRYAAYHYPSGAGVDDTGADWILKARSRSRPKKRTDSANVLFSSKFCQLTCSVYNFAQLNKTDMVLNNSRRSGFLALSAGQFVILFPFIKISFRKVFKKIYFPNFSSVTFQKCSSFLWYNSCLVVFRFPRDDSLILAMLEDPRCCWVG